MTENLMTIDIFFGIIMLLNFLLCDTSFILRHKFERFTSSKRDINEGCVLKLACVSDECSIRCIIVLFLFLEFLPTD